MKLTILVDNFVTAAKVGLLGEWGYSALLETPAGALLIDTGASGRVLLNNMKVLGHDPAKLSCLALSHGHDDHTGGLTALLEAAPQVRGKVYASPFATRERLEGESLRPAGGLALREVSFLSVEGRVEILPDVWAFDVPPAGRNASYVTRGHMFERGEDGEVRPDTFADDLSFLVRGERGWSLLLGCAHAALPNIVTRVAELFGLDEFDTIAGGTHMKSLEPWELAQWTSVMSEWPVQRWRLNHCTGFRPAARIAQIHADADWAGVGTTLEI